MSTYEISKSSLLSLKAEILRKQDELNKVRTENDIKIRNLKKNAPLDLKNKGVEARAQIQDSAEEENLLAKSRESLEAKARLYEKLSTNQSKLTPQEEEFNKRYLVRFNRKNSRYDHSDDEDYSYDNYEAPKSKDEEWVEYIDCLGRTRTCLRKDLDYLKRKDKDLRLIVDSKERNRRKSRSRSPEKPPVTSRKSPTPPPKEPLDPDDENELLSNDMRREVLRKQWENEEEALRDKSDIHYQDILFNEARTHGVGYYSFSKDEEVRAKQQEALTKLREETKEKQKKAQELKKQREKQLHARIRAAKNRKRERMGLPPLQEGEEEEQPKTQEDEEEVVIEEPKDTKLDERRKKHVRPWDIGKEGVKGHYEHSQEEWVDKKRRERDSEFAPPTSYHHSQRRRSKSPPRRSFRAAPIRNELSESDEEENRTGGAAVPPPATYDYYGSTSAKRTRRNSDSSIVSDSIDAGLKFLREQLERKQRPDRVDMFS